MTVKHFLFCTILTDEQLTVKIYKRPASVKRLKNTDDYITVNLQNPKKHCDTNTGHTAPALVSCHRLLKET